jgi:sugar O-acyltransferase (sialic acid O-acetyltransferase NeuD family)
LVISAHERKYKLIVSGFQFLQLFSTFTKKITSSKFCRMKEIIIAGAGGLGREVLQIIKDINKLQPTWSIKGFINDIPDALDNFECSHRIIGTIDSWQPSENEEYVCAVADPAGKQLVVEKLLSRGARFTSVIHPTAIIGSYAQTGIGLIMYPYARINVNCRIGNFVTLLSSPIGHDSSVGDFCTISTNCTITGYVNIGKRVFVSSGSTLIPKIKVDDDVYIGAGSVVISNLKAGVRVAGNPARPFLPVKD